MLSTKAKIKERVGSDDFWLSFAGKPLEDGRTLVECNVRPRSLLELVPRVRGGMKLEITNVNGDKLEIEVNTSKTKLNLRG